MTSKEESAASLSSLEDLPDSLLGHVVGYLTFSDGHGRLFAINRHFWYHVRPVVALTTVEVVVDLCDNKESFEFMAYTRQTSSISKALSLYSKLQVLDLQSYATDMLLAAIVADGYFPALTTIRMSRSVYLSDKGLLHLSNHKSDDESVAGESTIREIDITFCRNTSYQGTFVLRDKLTNLELLRRQPAWLDGNFYTPFGSTQVEVHTYWPDGTFSFNRDSQSTGFVLSWEDWSTKSNPSYLGDRLQFNNFAPGAWPVWSRYAYRPGVCLLELESSIDETIRKSTNERYVLVGQRLKGLRAPNIYAAMTEVAPRIAVGTSRYVDPVSFQIYDEPDDARERILVSKMKVLPLPTSSMMPPKALVEECRQTCEAMKDYGEEFLSQKEWELDRFL